MGISFQVEHWYSPEEVAELSGWSLANLALWRSKGKGPGYTKLGRRIWYSGADLQKFWDSGRRRSTLEDARPAKPVPVGGSRP